MIPAATLVHHIPGRTRFRVASKQGDGSYFAGVGEQLQQCPGVTSVNTNAATGSVLILHEAAEPDVLIAYARTFEVFELPDQSAPAMAGSRPPAAIVSDGLRQMDDWIRAETGYGTDLRSVALTGLIGAAVWQMLRGHLLPAAGTLMWYALSIVSEGRQHSPGERTRQASRFEEVDSPAD
jgi:hypothetical protein